MPMHAVYIIINFLMDFLTLSQIMSNTVVAANSSQPLSSPLLVMLVAISTEDSVPKKLVQGSFTPPKNNAGERPSDDWLSAAQYYTADFALDYSTGQPACTDQNMQMGCTDLAGINWCTQVPYNNWQFPGAETVQYSSYNFRGDFKKYYGLNLLNSDNVAVNYLPNNVRPPNTHLMNPAWWKVDFASVYIVDQVQVYKSEGDRGTYLNGAMLSLGQKSGDFLDCGSLVYGYQAVNDNQDVCHKKMGNSAKITNSGLGPGGQSNANQLCVRSFTFKGWSVNAPINPSQRPSTASTDITDY